MIGIDIVEIERFESFAKDSFSSWNKVFTKKEWQYCFENPLPAQHLAGIFAAKEAIMKAVGESVMKRYIVIEIKHEQSGKPVATLSINTQHNVEISISHSKRNAIAVAVVI